MPSSALSAPRSATGSGVTSGRHTIGTSCRRAAQLRPHPRSRHHSIVIQPPRGIQAIRAASMDIRIIGIVTIIITIVECGSELFGVYEVGVSALPRRYPVPPPQPQPRRELGVLGTVAFAVGAVALGAYMLDLHAHRCDCGHQWHHLGVLNFGEATSHTCKKCGAVQWWKDGAQHVFREVLRSQPPLETYEERRRRLALTSPYEGAPSKKPLPSGGIV